jgi:hypothetical protein
LLGDFLLPPSNNLPHTYKELVFMMKYIGMEYQSIYAFPKNHITYYGEHEKNIECPQCRVSIYRSDQNKK